MRQSSLSAALAIMTGAGLLLSAADEAAAAVVMQSQAFNIMTTNGDTSVTVPFTPFDALLGTLTEVDISLSGPSFTGSEMFSYSGGEGGGAGFSETAAVVEPSGSTLTSAAGSDGTSCFSGGGDPCNSNEPMTVTPPGLSTSVVALTAPSALAPYTGLVSPSFTAELENYSAPAGDCSFGSCSQTDTVNFAGTLNVTYDYTPAAIVTPVPEPASMTLLGSGLLALLAARRRRRG